MENFASDGGDIAGDSGPARTKKFYPDLKFSAYNLWGIRPALGHPVDLSSGADLVYIDDIRHYRLSGGPALPTLGSGGTVQLSGYGTAASHEKIYRLAGECAEYPLLRISVNDDDASTRYYAVVPREGPDIFINRERGKLGADVHPLTGNGNYINTEGRPAYLFVVTLYRDVAGVQVTYSWQPAPSLPVITTQPVGRKLTAGQRAVFTADADGSPAPALQWQVSAGGGEWTDIPGATSGTLTLEKINIEMDGNRYRLIAENLAGAAESDCAVLEVEPPNYGDVRGSGYVSSVDVSLLRLYIAALCKEPFYASKFFNEGNADVNGDGKIDADDVRQLRAFIASGGNPALIGPPAA
jgi:hypothetical protein